MRGSRESAPIGRTPAPAPTRPVDVRRGAVVRLAFLAAVVAGLAGCSGAGDASPVADDRPVVVATTTLLADLVAQVGGDAVRVVPLVPKGGEVHTYDPRPSDLVAVADARLIVMNGLGLDDWLGRIAANAGSEAPIVRLGERIMSEVYILDEDGRPNPHLWLDVRQASGYVGSIATALEAADPANAAGYAERATAYARRLGELDRWVRERIETIPPERRAFVSFHDALPYYAATYGLEIVGVVVPAPGQEPSAGEIADLVAAIREAGVRAVFSEVQFDPALADALASEAGARVVADLYTDTLGDPPVDTYEGVIRWDTDRIVEALR